MTKQPNGHFHGRRKPCNTSAKSLAHWVFTHGLRLPGTCQYRATNCAAGRQPTWKCHRARL